MTQQASTSALILAGGAGRRVGGQDKGLLPWHGKPLIEHVVARLKPQVDNLYISCNRNFEQYRHWADVLIPDTRENYQGPLAGIEAASPQIESEYLIVVACDTPVLPIDLVHRLIQPLISDTVSSSKIAYAFDGNRNQYLCAALHSSCLETLPQFLGSGQRAVRHWYKTHNAIAVDLSDEASAFENYNYLHSKNGIHD
ncbi:MAG: molybdenum cofactor guanylyltransferase MobA, partial [Halioglobus sp.]